MLIFVTKTNTADKLFFMRFLYANTFIIYFGRKKMKIEEKIESLITWGQKYPKVSVVRKSFGWRVKRICANAGRICSTCG